MSKRLIAGIKLHTDSLATAMFEGIDFKSDFLKQRATRELVPKEQYLPSPVIDRGSIRAWKQSGELDALDRAKSRVNQLLDGYQPPDIDTKLVDELKSMVAGLAADAGMQNLPSIDL